VKAASDALRRIHSTTHDAKSTDGLWKRAEMLSKFFSIHHSESTRPLLGDCVKDMIAKLERPDRVHSYHGDEISVLKRCPVSIKPLGLLFDYGAPEYFDRFGKWASTEESRMATLVDLFKGMSKDGSDPIVFVRDVLNKCLVQHSIGEKWAGNPLYASSLHVRLLLKEYPAVAYEKDDNGRLPIHHAVLCSSPRLDNVTDIFNANPKGASVADPVTRLYPFMLAASKDSVAVAFKLLLANPSLVDTRFDDEGSSRKRKRSLSIND